MKSGRLTSIVLNVTRYFRMNVRRDLPRLPAASSEIEVVDSEIVHCATHGKTAQTFVCQHIVEGLVQHERVGFYWSIERTVAPYPDAWCANCNERVKLTHGEWQGEALAHLEPKILCAECYEVAKKFHLGGDPWS